MEIVLFFFCSFSGCFVVAVVQVHRKVKRRLHARDRPHLKEVA